MNIYDCKLWLHDLDATLANLPELGGLSGQSVLITGAGGLICSAVVDLLIRHNEAAETPVTIYAAGRDEGRMRARFGRYMDAPWFRFVQYDAARRTLDMDLRPDYIIHGASNASPGKIVKEPVETMASNFTGLMNLFELARRAGTKRVLYVSSSEVYGRKESAEPFREGEYGYIDLLNPRNSYSVGKRAAETLCASYYGEYGVDSVIVRPGHIYGPTASVTDNRVSSQWAYAAAKGEDIVMKSDGAQVRSYCHCLDCASAILKVLLKGESCRAYNISNPDSIISIRRMAQLLAESGGVQLRMELPSEAERRAFNPMNNSSLDSSSLLELGWRGIFGAAEGLGHTVAILREMA